MASETCGCGEPLHYSDPEIQGYVQAMVDELGETVKVVTPRGTWEVPRHYIACHGLKEQQLPELAARYEWAKVA